MNNQLRIPVLILSFLATVAYGQSHRSLPFRDLTLPLDLRVKDLVSRLTLDEKIAQMDDGAPSIPRLGIPAYNWHVEGAHGAWAWGGIPNTTVYPQVIGLAASWNTSLIHEIAAATSDEIRAVYFEDDRKNPNGNGNNGLSVFAPNINIFRDPRWGRGQETYGEDPVLTSRLSLEFIKGLQGGDPRYLKVAATAKHFAVYSGPEDSLFKTNVNPSNKDLWETYLPAFETAIVDAHASSVMCAYGSVNGAPACANVPLLDSLLRKTWGFKGPVVSDCGAIRYIWTQHKYGVNEADGVKKALLAGTDLSCQGGDHGKDDQNDYTYLKDAVRIGMVSEKDIDVSVARLFEQRFRLGMFDPASLVPYSKIPSSTIDSEEHRKLAAKAARESLVLLKNKNHILPLPKTLRKISVIGPNAIGQYLDHSKKPQAINVLTGTYHGTPSRYVTALDGIKNKLTEASSETKVVYRSGAGDPARWIESIKGSDVAILVLGLIPLDDDKEGDFANGEGEGRDRRRIELPAEQTRMLEAVKGTGIPMVVVLMNGGALASVYAEENANAVMEAWYPGEEGGTAIADVLFGDYNPSGRLPVTFYRSTQDLPAFTDYHMSGRTYRYFKGKPLYPFGFGLSYTRFHYSNLSLQSKRISPQETLNIKVDVRNFGDVELPSRVGDEVVQVYLSGPSELTHQPIRSLKAFVKTHLNADEIKTLNFSLDPSALSIVSDVGVRAVVPGHYTVSVGGQQPEASLQANQVKSVLVSEFEIIK